MCGSQRPDKAREDILFLKRNYSNHNLLLLAL